ncbi:zinc-binding dehydrogenase [Oceanobacillus sp. J11TS1]|uniref:zinc-binding dehydrogenase n=1 Tax=Oceanobacillus sp. J11TS1 TaxID=2807191 RepID=UPI001B21E4D3|nr:zinc-binding dehydrogenase [Oceanobacillus sp. J11TS1]GIO22385.1 putative zinc-type alcohol dehydrogenase-like protein YogA [Oceanobacillus sp. J11TS1]
MRALVHENGSLHLKDMELQKPEGSDVVIKLKAAGLNRRDLTIPNRRKEAEEALILGSDGAGIIEEVGKNVTDVKVGDEVIINPSLRWVRNSEAPPKEFDILGMPDHGTFADKIVISEDQVEPKPSYMSWEEAAAFPLAALTGYRAMFTKGQLQKGETVFIPGAGGGVATYLIAFAKNIGARVITTSRSKKKREKALELGADIVIDTADDWKEKLSNETIDMVIDSNGKATFQRSLAILKKGGKFVTFGATTDDVVEFDLRSFFYGQFKLIGSTMGCREELVAALEHAKRHQLRPVVDRIFPLDQSLDALRYLDEGNQFGKVIIRIS